MLIRTREQFLPGGLFNPKDKPGFKNGKHGGFQDGHPDVSKRPSRKRTLTPKQSAFVREYLEHGKALQAARNAGYAPAVATVNASKLFSHPRVAAEIAKVQEERHRRHEITADRVIEELAKIAFANPLDYMRPTASGDPYIDFSSLTPDQAAALDVTVETSYADGRELKRVRVKLQDKQAALVSLARHFGIFNDRNDRADDVRGDVYSTIIDAANRLAARRIAGGAASLPDPGESGGAAVRLEMLGQAEPATAAGDD